MPVGNKSRPFLWASQEDPGSFHFFVPHLVQLEPSSSQHRLKNVQNLGVTTVSSLLVTPVSYVSVFQVSLLSMPYPGLMLVVNLVFLRKKCTFKDSENTAWAIHVLPCLELSEINSMCKKKVGESAAQCSSVQSGSRQAQDKPNKPEVEPARSAKVQTPPREHP